MDKYYTRPCNFYFGKQSKKKVQKKETLAIGGNSLISFDSIEIISRKNKKLINIKQIKNLRKNLREKINFDITNIVKKKLLRSSNYQIYQF